MKRTFFIVFLAHFYGLAFGQEVYKYNLREMFKDPLNVGELNLEYIDADSLTLLIENGFDLSKLKVNEITISLKIDSASIVNILELLKPVSNTVKHLGFYSRFCIDISSFSSLESLDICNIGGLNNNSILKIKTLDRIFINGKYEDVKLKISESDPLFSSGTITGLTILLDSADTMPYEQIRSFYSLNSLIIEDPNLKQIPDDFKQLLNLRSCSFYEHSINDKSINTLFELPSIQHIYLQSKGEFPKVYWWLLKKHKKNIKIKTSLVTQVYISGRMLKGKDLRYARRLKRKLKKEEGVKIEYRKKSKKLN